MKRYVIRIYTKDYSFSNYDDSIYEVPEKEVNFKDILLQNYTNTIQELLFFWNKLIKDYEGYTYCVKDVIDEVIIVGGIFDPSGKEIINEYL